MARLRQTSRRFGVSTPGAALRTLARIVSKACRCCGWAFWLLIPLWRLLTIACSSFTGAGRISLISPGRHVEPVDQAALPGLWRPGQHRGAKGRAEVDQRRDVEQVMAIVGLLGIGDEEPRLGDPRRVREPVREEQRLARPVRPGALDDLLDRRRGTLRERVRGTNGAIEARPRRSGARTSETKIGRRGARGSGAARRPCARHSASPRSSWN